MRFINSVAPKHLNHEWLRKQYVDYRRSLEDLARECGVAPDVITRTLRRHNIRVRQDEQKKVTKLLSQEHKRTRERVDKNFPEPYLRKTLRNEDLRAPHLTPLPPEVDDYLILRVDVGWLSSHARWVITCHPKATFAQLAAATLAVVGWDKEEKLSHFVVPNDGRSPRRERAMAGWRPTLDDIVVPIITEGNEDYGKQLVGSPNTTIAVAVGKGWCFGFLWDYQKKHLFTMRCIDASGEPETKPTEKQAFKFLATPTRLSLGKKDQVSLKPLDVENRVRKALRGT